MLEDELETEVGEDKPETDEDSSVSGENTPDLFTDRAALRATLLKKRQEGKPRESNLLKIALNYCA